MPRSAVENDSLNCLDAIKKYASLFDEKAKIERVLAEKFLKKVSVCSSTVDYVSEMGPGALCVRNGSVHFAENIDFDQIFRVVCNSDTGSLNSVSAKTSLEGLLLGTRLLSESLSVVEIKSNELEQKVIKAVVKCKYSENSKHIKNLRFESDMYNVVKFKYSGIHADAIVFISINRETNSALIKLQIPFSKKVFESILIFNSCNYVTFDGFRPSGLHVIKSKDMKVEDEADIRIKQLIGMEYFPSSFVKPFEGKDPNRTYAATCIACGHDFLKGVYRASLIYSHLLSVCGFLLRIDGGVDDWNTLLRTCETTNGIKKERIQDLISSICKLVAYINKIWNDKTEEKIKEEIKNIIGHPGADGVTVGNSFLNHFLRSIYACNPAQTLIPPGTVCEKFYAIKGDYVPPEHAWGELSSKIELQMPVCIRIADIFIKDFESIDGIAGHYQCSNEKRSTYP